MERRKSFTGRARRLTNRWDVKLGDALARGFITVGGTGTIATVLMVFVFLLYVAFPLFLPATLGKPVVTTRPNRALPLLYQVDDRGVLSWKIFPDSVAEVAQLQSGAPVLKKPLLEGHQVTSAASYPDRSESAPDRSEFALGLDDGSLVLGAFIETTRLRKPSELPPAIVDLRDGETVDFENGVIGKTPQGLYRWQSVGVEVKEPIALIEDSALTHVDFLHLASSLSVLAVADNGQVVIAEFEELDDILTGEKQLELSSKRALPLPENRPSKAWKAFLLGRGNAAIVLWRDGYVARYDLQVAGGPAVVEERSLLTAAAELTAAITLQGRYTLLVGDSQGGLSAWFTASSRVNDQELVSLVKGHELPPLDGPVTALARSRLLRVVAAGSSTGQLSMYFVSSSSQLVSTHAFDAEPVEQIVLLPNDDAAIALSRQHQWQAALDLRHPEASFASLFRPVWYEGYDEPLNKWQSSSGSQESEPKFGLIPLIFGTLKATFYSMLFGAPIALLAAIYSSEFLDPSVKAPIKSLIEMMAAVPSVVLGFLAGLVFAPFVEEVLPSLLAAFFFVPFLFLVGAQLWQLLPHKTALQMTKLRLPALGVILLLGIALSAYSGAYVQSWLFGGDLKAWLNQSHNTSTGGWFVLLLPLSAVTASLLVKTYANPWLRKQFGAMPRERFALLNLGKFAVVSVVTVAIAYALGAILNSLGIDSRGGILDSYVQRNALVVGFVMGFAIIPLIYTISEDALSTVPKHLRSASLACGATQWQTTWRVVVPTAASGLFSAVMIGMGRAVGETMIMLMATGNVPIMDINLFSGFRTLSANIAEELSDAPVWGTHFRILFFTGLALLVLTFFINTAAEGIRISFRRRAAQL